MATIADYQGRTFDILAFQPSANSTEMEQALASEANGGLICTGIQKLAQRWTLEFLTPIGSIPYKPNIGSYFMIALRTGQIRTDVDVVSFFSGASSQVSGRLKTEDLDSDKDDEKLDSADLLYFDITEDRTLVLSVQINSLAGTSREVILPISVTAGLI
jgi:hypothetical protein